MRKYYALSLITGLLIALLASFWFAAAAHAAVRLDADTMKAMLRTATPEEDGFITVVLAKVDDGTLPLDLVNSTLQWARKKPTKHRFQYFKQALIVRAKQIGVEL